MPYPFHITVVPTCTVLAPTAMNSTASCQEVNPPKPETGKPVALAIWATQRRAMGLMPGPEYPPYVDRPPMAGKGVRVSRSTPIKPDTVFTVHSASAPLSLAAWAMNAISLTLGVSLTTIGTFATFLTQATTFPVNSAFWPMKAPMPLDGMPCGHDTLSSRASMPASCTASARRCQFFSTGASMMLAHSGRSG